MFVCLFVKNSKTTPHINLKFCTYIISKESDISQDKKINFSNFPPEVNISLYMQTQPANVLG